jgi:hypothetical protein
MIEAQALVDAWICTPFDSGPEALDDLIVRIAAALASRDLLDRSGEAGERRGPAADPTSGGTQAEPERALQGRCPLRSCVRLTAVESLSAVHGLRGSRAAPRQM